LLKFCNQHGIELIVTEESFLNFSEENKLYKITKILVDLKKYTGSVLLPVLLIDDNMEEIIEAQKQQKVDVTTLRICEEGEFTMGIDDQIRAFISRVVDTLQVAKTHTMVSIAITASVSSLAVNKENTAQPAAAKKDRPKQVPAYTPKIELHAS